MLEHQRPKLYPNRLLAESAAPFLIAAGSLAFALTLAASRKNHSKLHENIAQIAYLPEALIILAGLGIAKTKTNEPLRKISRRAAIMGSGATGLCFGAVFLTDRPFNRFLQSAKGRDDLVTLTEELIVDVKRHLISGVRSFSEG